MKEFLSIKEFSKLADIGQTTLRYWDDIGLFVPAKRDAENNYRYYSWQQLISVKFVTVMSNINVSLKEIGELQGNRHPEGIVSLIEQQEKALDMEMRRLHECYSIVHTRRELINYGSMVLKGFETLNGIKLYKESDGGGAVYVDATKIAIMHENDTPFILGPRNKWKPGEGFCKPFMNFCRHADHLRMNLSFPIGAMHDGWEGFVEAPGEPHYFCSLDPTGNNGRPAGEYLVGFARGYYGEFGDLAERMKAYIKEHDLTVKGPVYSIYLHDEVSANDPSQYLSEVSVAVSK
ncbi:MAG: MerR family transcriptional regulator [Oscillospiraceae bacterium]|nr:MerR family transcriptional regulator [Oscillospiraceae bacterium]